MSERVKKCRFLKRSRERASLSSLSVSSDSNDTKLNTKKLSLENENQDNPINEDFTVSSDDPVHSFNDITSNLSTSSNSIDQSPKYVFVFKSIFKYHGYIVLNITSV